MWQPTLSTYGLGEYRAMYRGAEGAMDDSAGFPIVIPADYYRALFRS
jgi:hypothetical protein